MQKGSLLDHTASVHYNRSAILDALRGFAVVLMVIFHFCYDLTLFDLASIPIYQDARWIAFRYIIVSLFLGAMGASLYLHMRKGMNWHSYWRRLVILALSAGAITFITFFALKEKYIFFGILHLIILSSLLGLFFVRFFWLNLLFGTLILWIGFGYSNAFFNQTWLLWLGLRTLSTGAADYTPVFPWFGAVLIGMFMTRLLGNRLFHSAKHLDQLIFLGRHSLIIYLLHQPVLWGLLAIYIQLVA